MVLDNHFISRTRMRDYTIFSRGWQIKFFDSDHVTELYSKILLTSAFE
ncbi:hypothetical protein falkor_74 [Salmonella phage falkor]|uniref:Uncharacterized protein n=3 Tax=Epseptimavirus TaxID=2732017 RepID=A0A6G8RKL0_9CAUD|nr:hypothetical protein HWC16_gp127 [Salmonella phage Sepoy]QCQ65615.1 hypothetical protein Sepoy_150 [Salmonella phage Sepoy]QIO01889.1 hypothetical protein falkor_74 [Salmonella phage falkor]